MGRARGLAELATGYDAGALQFRNRIINGDMRIDQRNAGAAVTAMSPGYVFDRFAMISGSGSFTIQQSTTAPTGFSNSMSITVASAATRLATDYSFFYQTIEGFNTADFGMGSAGASTVTLSFWVRSSIAGLYSGVLASGANNRSYGFTYTINATNTWEYKTVTVVGDTTGGTTEYPTGNAAGFRVKFDLGSGSNYQVTAGSWQAATNKTGVAGTVSWAQTSGATFYITGVQLEVGSVATPFERRPYGTELALCQRYCYVLPAANSLNGALQGNTSTFLNVPFPVPMRATPTAKFSNSTYTVDDYYSTTTTGTEVTSSAYGNVTMRIWVTGHASLTVPRPMETAPTTNTCVTTISAEL